MGYVKWSYDTLDKFCHDVFRKFGFDEDETEIIKDVLLTADLYGIESHGMQRMVRYDKGIEKGNHSSGCETGGCGLRITGISSH